MRFELTGVLLALFPGLAKAWLATNNTKNSKVQRKPEETQVIMRIWWKSNWTVVSCQGLVMKTDRRDLSLLQQNVCVIEFSGRRFFTFYGTINAKSFVHDLTVDDNFSIRPKVHQGSGFRRRLWNAKVFQLTAVTKIAKMKSKQGKWKSRANNFQDKGALSRKKARKFKTWNNSRLVYFEMTRSLFDIFLLRRQTCWKFTVYVCMQVFH